MIAKNPVLGSASGGFSTEDSKIVVDAEGWRAIVTAGPHHQYLLIDNATRLPATEKVADL